jgi:hypothetical protein
MTLAKGNQTLPLPKQSLDGVRRFGSLWIVATLCIMHAVKKNHVFGNLGAC